MRYTSQREREREEEFEMGIIYALLLLLPLPLACESSLILPNLKFGVVNELSACQAQVECTEPFYCLNSTVGYSCRRKSCRNPSECRIGQKCTVSGFCDVAFCISDDRCPGETICSNSGRCNPKGSGGFACTRDSQCWSGFCARNKCTPSAFFDGNYRWLTAGTITAIALFSVLILLLLAFLIFAARNCTGKA